MQSSAYRRISSRILAVAFAVTLAVVPLAEAQTAGIVSGVVTDAANNAVFGARISLTGTSLVASTDELGQFRIAGVAIGATELNARRLGFAPSVQQIRVTLRESDNRVHVRLAVLPNTVSPVVVQANRVKDAGRLAGYYERLRRRSGGYFIAREEIDRSRHRTLSQLISQTPGVNAMRSRTGVGAVRMRGRGCRPLVWLDGTPMPAGEVDLDAFSPSTLHGIELYLGGSMAPMDYTAVQGQSNCGTILLWSRGRDTEMANNPSRPTVDVEMMVASLSIYTSDQVDKPAALAGAEPLEVLYPPSLFAGGIGGKVVAEFVVDTAGKIEAGTLAIISSPHPLFSAAVSEGLGRASYSPAFKNGRAVRQVVYQPVAFGAGTGRSRKEGGD